MIVTSTAIASGVILFLICMGYSALVEYAHRHWPSARHYTFFEVIVGCAMVVGAASFAMGLDNALIVAAYFCVAGLPMSVGAIIGHIIDDHQREKEQQAEVIRDRSMEETKFSSN